jgi:hypothetical protein
MHLIIAFAAPPSAGARAQPEAMTTPALDNLIARWAEAGRDEADASTLSPPHERAHAAALGLSGADGCLPWAARQAAADGIAVGRRSWGLVTPAHWRVGSDGVHLADPAALELGAAESRTLFDAVRPLFEAESYTPAWGAALRWYVAHDALEGLATASLDRVVGRNIDAWIPRQPAARGLRRLQNEVQMLLHQHPLNEAREARGALPVNSFWLSGCGALQPEHGGTVRLEERLRGPALQGDDTAWRAAWQALDAEAIAPLLAGAAHGEAARLSLCGERTSVEFAPRAPGWRRRIADTFFVSRASARQILESL